MTTEPLHPNAEKLISTAEEFLSEVADLTPGTILENHLNTTYGPGNKYYDTFRSLILQALSNAEPWVATDPLDGPKYRRSRLVAPSERTRYFSITTVYMESVSEYRGQYHLHPYGEINCVIPVTEGAELKGMNGWQGAGWTAPAAGTHHYPEVRGGALVALFFLPAGRISYAASPEMEQPGYV
ncbi:hypothetical protein BDW74DRAFT_182751 [Aspergillus multicolor]|uniref:DUF4863 family protein n=1 Tax=Aspergillus multicolor TaxID=41759 RepID=UPI003CCD2141